MLTAWNFREPDRVPVEIGLYAPAEGLAGSDIIADFVATEADNFRGTPGFDWGFLGLSSEYREEVLEDIPNQHRRIKRFHSTPAGEFTAITVHDYAERDPGDYHWEKRYIETLDDFARLADAERDVRPFDLDAYNQGCVEIGNRGLPATSLLHPLGSLVRNSNMNNVYVWLLTEPEITERYLRTANRQVVDSVLALSDMALRDPPVFLTYALEMLTPPWFGKDQFMKFVFAHDQPVNDAVHQVGGRHRAHCHGNSGAFLEIFADMGIDGVEPLEPPPFGDNILAEAKKTVGNRMLLAGNVPSQAFFTLTRDEVRDMTKQAIDDAAAGGGFNLRLSGGAAGGGKTEEQSLQSIRRGIDFIEAAMEFGKY